MVRPRQNAGFTLIELLMVITIMGILAAVMLPTTDPTVYDQLRSAAQVVAADVGYARSLAVTNNSTYEITFDMTGNKYTLEHGGSNSALDSLPETPFRSKDDPSDEQIVKLDELPMIGIPVALHNVYAASNTPVAIKTIEFDAKGATDRSEDTVVWLTAGNGTSKRYLSVRVSAVTGLTWIEDFRATEPNVVVEEEEEEE
jgi:prepilin-type N-terminal cleavage/methylation domain-containing protein